MTRTCFEPAWFLFSGSVMAGCAAFAVIALAAVNFGERFFEDFGIGILDSVYGGVAPHHRSPTTANKPAGQDSRGFMTPGLLLSSGADESIMIDPARRPLKGSAVSRRPLSRRKQGS